VKEIFTCINHTTCESFFGVCSPKSTTEPSSIFWPLRPSNPSKSKVRVRTSKGSGCNQLLQHLERGDPNRRTVSRDWNKWNSRSHNFNVVIESRERGDVVCPGGMHQRTDDVNRTDSPQSPAPGSSSAAVNIILCPSFSLPISYSLGQCVYLSILHAVGDALVHCISTNSFHVLHLSCLGMVRDPQILVPIYSTGPLYRWHFLIYLPSSSCHVLFIVFWVSHSLFCCVFA